jgi:hypothetical protein
MRTIDRTDEEDEATQALRELTRARSGGPALRGVFARRALRAVAELSRRMEEPALQEAVSAPSDFGVLLAALEAEPGLSLLTRDDPLAGAKLRGLAARQDLLSREGGTLGVQEVADLLQLSRQAVHKRHRAGRLLAIDCGRHGDVYPAWQFVPGGVLPGLEEVLQVLAGMDPWMQLAFFVNENLALDGETPLAALRGNDLAAALRAARLYGEQAAL